MKPINLLSTFFALGLATTVTAGTMYVTAKAAVQQEQDNLRNIGSGQDEAAGELNAEPVPAVPEVVDSAPALAPEEIVHDRQHNIVLNAEGGFKGRLNALSNASSAPASNYTVKILQHGTEVAVTKTDADGQFSVTGLTPGVSGIVAISESGLMLFSARLVQAEPGQAIPVSVDLAMDSAVVAGADVKLARELISSALSTEEVRFSAEASADDDAFQFGNGEKSTSLVGHQIQLDEDGNLRGQVNVMDERTGRYREVLDMMVHFLRDGKVVGSADVKPDGSFTVAGLNPGVHSVVGTGKDGVFALGVDILGSSYEPEKKPGEASPVSLIAAPEFSVSPVRTANLNTEDADEVTDGTIQSANPATETAYAPAGQGGGAPGSGGGGTTGGGGGGGIGGGGGLGGLLGAAAGGALGYALGRDNDASPNN